ncbi:hypothetical protein PHYSODRAFT_298372 [Phytophthora sojae]|uniref:Polycystin cation channel PKD1/PKD2 domain-containing protein n=1 Tax=Phytophthora sojae (strain P6497) TaxID=1094619 RepID=G4Z3Q0_PHYSP|nr:hypothetical protein PHYSODRAFT_298372 [Phytophthora sojae]EGZ20119.1 hypothetical protein PHYSODRAFT_298372 [Phytophthora sojae]|eukprot:XP_009522836.1 hypothetical protein PHYSODRAFT_298372 [Phytophthora sojae]
MQPTRKINSRLFKELLESIDRAVVELNALAFAGAVTIIQLGFFVLRQMRFHRQLNIFASTVETSLRRFFGSFFVFMIIFLAFSFMVHSLFDKRVLQFSTPAKSMESCVNMLFGEFDFDSIREISASSLFYWVYMLVVSLELLSMMLAIVMAAYEAMNKEAHEDALTMFLSWRSKKLWTNLLLLFMGRKNGIAVALL